MTKDGFVALQLSVARCVGRGLSQKQIADLLGISQSRVSRLRGDNPFLIPPQVDLSSIKEANREVLMSQSDVLLKEDKLRERLALLSPYGARMKADVMYEKGEYDIKAEEGFDTRASKAISKLVNRSKYVGVAWDRGIKPYAYNIPDFVTRDGLESDNPINFIPLCGITPSLEDAVLSSSTVVAMSFNKLVNKNYGANSPTLYNLNCIPLIHPKLSDAPTKKDNLGLPDKKDVTDYLLKAFPDYEEIFGSMKSREEQSVSNDCLIKNVDMIFTGNGANGFEAEMLLDVLYPNEKHITILKNKKKEKSEFLSENVVGDIAGVFLPNIESGDTEYNCQIANSVNSRLATLRSEHLTYCCERAIKTKKKPGVVLIAHGKRKARSVLTAVKMGYVTRLIIDYELGKAIEEYDIERMLQYDLLK